MTGPQAVPIQPPVLAIDCSGSALDIAVRIDQETTSVRLSAAQSHDELIADAVASLLRGVGLRVADVKGLIVGGGPGSFTGIRIALAFAVGMSWSNGCPLAMALSPVGAAWDLRGGSRDLAIFSSAGKHLLYFTRIGGSGLGRLVTEPAVMPYTPGGTDEALREVASGCTVVWCEDNGCPAELASNAVHPTSIAGGLIGWLLDGPQGAEAEGWLKITQGASSLASIEPFYVRPVAAKSLIDRGIALDMGSSGLLGDDGSKK